MIWDWESRRVIVRLVNEKESMQSVPPTLLIAPTSVVGNWLHEIAKLPRICKRWYITAAIALNSQLNLSKPAKQRCCYHLIYIGSERRKLLSSVEWQRVVLDEAQNIKIPKRLKPAPSFTS